MSVNESNGWRESADAWIEFVRNGDTNRSHLLDPIMLGLCGNPDGLTVLDVGCGEGRFSRMLAKRGAFVVGIDPTVELIHVAHIDHPAGCYLKSEGENLPFKSGSFDQVISYLTLIDIAGYKEAIREMVRVLKPKGRLIVANLHPIATSVPSGWVKDAKGHKLHFPVDHYFEERPEEVAWCGIAVDNWHRPLAGYMNEFLGCGLRLLKYLEPTPSKQAIQSAPNLRDCSRVPIFNIMSWGKE
jgi:SAM-dependent methyltransferase